MTEFIKTGINGLLLIEPDVHRDDRGFFMETFRADLLAKNGINYQFVQDNHSGSKKNILRGLHYQIRNPQGKLVRAIRGEIFDVAVDLRRSSNTFGKWVSIILTEENKKIFWIPPGFAHGYYVLSDWAEIFYKATDYYAPECDRSLLWNDPDIGIKWPIPTGAEPILSQKDRNARRLKEAEVYD
jgi:dTDP-4-dehydrorhamnose 3,5-epimerase